MLDDNDPPTFLALSELVDLKSISSKPIVFWIGAGASMWANLPSWSELADTMHREFLRHQNGYSRQKALGFCEEKNYPGFFQICKDENPQRYHNILYRELSKPRKIRSVYERLIVAIKKCHPSGIITTNVDELLERSLEWPVIQASNIERAPTMLLEQNCFVAKIHGSITDMSTLVFTEADYKRVSEDTILHNVLSRIFQSTHVIFIGYGLADKHVLRALQICNSLNTLFGDGPHFACLPAQIEEMPSTVRVIRYSPEPHKDHRCAIQIVEELAVSTSPDLNIAQSDSINRPHDLISAHFLADVYPPGTWLSSQRCELAIVDQGPTKAVMYAGHGLTNEELPNTLSTALHDVIVGLLCFDQVFASLKTLNRMVSLISLPTVVQLLSNGLLRFVRMAEEEVIMFPEGDQEAAGHLTCAVLDCGSDGKPLSIDRIVHRLLPPKPGREKDADKELARLCAALDQSTIVYRDNPETDITKQVRGLLVRPSFRRMLGMSTATPSGIVPTWLKYPIIRLAQVVRLGEVCRRLDIASAKLDYGTDLLATMSFGSSFAELFAHSVASYVVAGSLSTDLGEYMNLHPEIFDQVLRFRETSEGKALRKQILEHLCISAGGEVSAAINAGLRRFIPTPSVEAARHSFSKLLVPSTAGLPSVWHDAALATAALDKWRQKSASEFINHCKTLQRKSFETCPCGSGESVRNCCEQALGILNR